MTLEVQHIAKSYGENKVLQDVSFTLEQGQVKVLMGTNGSGKTTLFDILSGFLKPEEGKMTLNGKSIQKVSPYRLNRLGITRTFQDMRLVGGLSVLENVLLGFPKQSGEKWWKAIWPNEGVKAEQNCNVGRAKEILQTCFIEDVIDSKAAEISYGQQKLLNLACCLANDGTVVLLDEIVAGVNPVYREKLVAVINKMKEQGKTVLIIEHNTDFIEAVADGIFFLHNGQLTHFASYAILREDKMVQEAYL